MAEANQDEDEPPASPQRGRHDYSRLNKGDFVYVNSIYNCPGKVTYTSRRQDPGYLDEYLRVQLVGGVNIEVPERDFHKLTLLSTS